MHSPLIAGIGSAATNDGQQIQLSHQAQNRFKVHFFPGLALDPAPNAANAIGLFALFLTFHNQIRQPLILCSPFLSLSPCIISVSAHLKDLAHGFDAVLPAESFNDSIHSIISPHSIAHRLFFKTEIIDFECTAVFCYSTHRSYRRSIRHSGFDEQLDFYVRTFNLH